MSCLGQFLAACLSRFATHAVIVSLVVGLLPSAALAADHRASPTDARSRISHLVEIKLRDGMNDVQLDNWVDPDSGKNAGGAMVPGKIFRLPFNNEGPADPHSFVVVAPAANWTIAPVDGIGTTIEDERDDEILTTMSVRFFRGRLKGVPASLLITAELDARSDRGIGTRASISVFVLKVDAVDGPSSFERVYQNKTQKRYCNADFALFAELSAPLPEQYEGPPDGDCR